MPYISSARTCGNRYSSNDFHRELWIFLGVLQEATALLSLTHSFHDAENVVFPKGFEGFRITVRFPGSFFSWKGRKRCFHWFYKVFRGFRGGCFFLGICRPGPIWADIQACYMIRSTVVCPQYRNFLPRCSKNRIPQGF